MEIIAIGPRDHDKVYAIAAQRFNRVFRREMTERNRTGSTDDNL